MKSINIEYLVEFSKRTDIPAIVRLKVLYEHIDIINQISFYPTLSLFHDIFKYANYYGINCIDRYIDMISIELPNIDIADILPKLLDYHYIDMLPYFSQCDIFKYDLDVLNDILDDISVSNNIKKYIFEDKPTLFFKSCDICRMFSTRMCIEFHRQKNTHFNLYFFESGKLIYESVVVDLSYYNRSEKIKRLLKEIEYDTNN